MFLWTWLSLTGFLFFRLGKVDLSDTVTSHDSYSSIAELHLEEAGRDICPLS